ncbi:pyridoxal phosphate-dependent aminotransferase [Homoserinibacter sp. GY 40078]|uniref:pyridoxal phosphate-dependent aminotransferase n=1 Tax=Homoserinibacter sp. GY 40078 TaxID=2603275 RepID=UPI001650C108|nr:pyridoxal phosphate-dependent aminotransferase [Homoserinibacter sp. GY 40078]
MTSDTPAPSRSTGDAVDRLMAGPAGEGFIDLGIGEPDQPLPLPLAEAAVAGIRAGHTGYTPKLGLPELRRLIAEDTATDQGPSIAVEDVIVTIGGTGAVAIALLAAGGEGVLVPDPAWPNYVVLATSMGFRTRSYTQGSSGDDFFDLDEIEAGLRDGFRLVAVNSPSNPTGAVASRRALAALVDLVRRYDARILSDEAYESIVFAGGRAPSPLEVGGADVTFAARTFSKRFSMTGLRLGSLVSPPGYRREVAAIHGTTAGCAPITAQEVGIAALTEMPDRGDELARIYRDRYTRAAALLGPRLPALGSGALGGFYLWIDARDTGRTGTEIAAALAARGIGVSAGTVYSASEGFIRASLTAEDAALDLALATIATELDGSR